MSTPAEATGKIRTSKVRDLVQLGFRQRYEARLRLGSASELFFAHYRVAAPIDSEVASICRTLKIGQSTLGVHFRGTDKTLEAIAVSWRAFCRLVESTLVDNPHFTNIFVSSDEPAFPGFFRRVAVPQAGHGRAGKIARTWPHAGSFQWLPRTRNRSRSAGVQPAFSQLRISHQDAVVSVRVVEDIQSVAAGEARLSPTPRCVLVPRQPALA